MLDMLGLRQKADKHTLSLQELKVAAERSVNSILQGEHGRKRAGTGEKFWQYRDYIPGDRPQDIDWRQSAKTDTIFIREKERQTPQNIVYWCSNNASMHYKSDSVPYSKADCAKIITLALGILTTRAGENIAFFGSSKTGRSEKTLEHLAGKLSGQTETPSLPETTSYKLPKNSFLLQVGDFLDPIEDIEKMARYFDTRASSGLILQILDPDEIDLPFNGRVVFKDRNSNISQSVDHVSSIQQDYQNRINEHIAMVQHLCQRHGWYYTIHRTDWVIEDTLAQISNLIKMRS